jgi:DNA repair protein RadC
LPSYVHCPDDALRVLDLFTAGVAGRQFIILILNADHRGRIAAVFDARGSDPHPVDSGLDQVLLESSLSDGHYVILGSYRPGEDVEPTADDVEIWFDLVDSFSGHGLTVVDWFLLDEERWCSVGATVGAPWPW